MATLCKNCSHALVFNPESQLLECSYCGGSFRPDEIESEAKEYRQDLKAESMNEVYGTEIEKFMDCYVYSCSECGGEIIVNGTEASTTCVYCGNPNVVFSRIARQKCPEYVLPFSVTKEQAIELVRGKIGKGFFIPKQIKEFSPECVRGIYVPYWIVNATFSNAVIVYGKTGWGKYAEVNHYGRAGDLELKNFPVDASRALSDESSSKLEPFDLSHLKPFDEDYLAGFYSNVSDVTYGDVKNAVFKRAQKYFDEEVQDNVSAEKTKILHSCPSLKLDNDMVYAMMPVWFITLKHKRKHVTILVNGDTGKVVCGIPLDKSRFYPILFGLGILLTAAAFALFYYTFFILAIAPLLTYFLGAGIIVLFSMGIRKIVRAMRSIKLAQDDDMFTFMKKRQG